MNDLESAKSLRTVTVCLNCALDHVFLEQELIVYCPSKHGYFGIEGVAVEVFKVLMTSTDGLTEQAIISAIDVGNSIKNSDIDLIQSAIKTLLDLGVFHEK